MSYFQEKKRIDEINKTINDIKLERVHSTKLHINKIKEKLSKCLAILYRSSGLLDTSSLRVLYCSIFLPYVNYCCKVWGTTYSSTTNCIYILLKKAIRVIYKEKRLAKKIKKTVFFSVCNKSEI